MVLSFEEHFSHEKSKICKIRDLGVVELEFLFIFAKKFLKNLLIWRRSSILKITYFSEKFSSKSLARDFPKNNLYKKFWSYWTWGGPLNVTPKAEVISAEIFYRNTPLRGKNWRGTRWCHYFQTKIFENIWIFTLFSIIIFIQLNSIILYNLIQLFNFTMAKI